MVLSSCLSHRPSSNCPTDQQDSPLQHLQPTHSIEANAYNMYVQNTVSQISTYCSLKSKDTSMLKDFVMMDTISTPTQYMFRPKLHMYRAFYKVRLKQHSPQTHNVVSISIDSNSKVSNFTLLFEFLFTVLPIHVTPKPLAFRIVKLLIIFFIYLNTNHNK